MGKLPGFLFAFGAFSTLTVGVATAQPVADSIAAPDQSGPAASPAASPESSPKTSADPEPMPPPVMTSTATMAPPPPLPALPPTPIMSGVPYPDCREEHKAAPDPYESAAVVNRCIELIDQYRAEILAPFQQSMIDHQAQVIALYEQDVREAPQYSSDQRTEFYDAVMKEHGDANPDGPHLRAYTAGEARYQRDRTYLSDRFCYYTGCNGYPAPVVASVPKAPKAERSAKDEKVASGDTSSKSDRKKKKNDGCGTERAGGGLLGGVLGGVLGKGAGAAIAGQVGGMLLGEIACRLTKKEQEQAEAATLEVVRSAEVGATSSWVSESRSDVSGTSTVVAMNSQPSGSTCLSIVDVIIVEGEEARVSKQMCRKPGESRYTLAA